MDFKINPLDVRKALTFAWKICKDDFQVGSDFGRNDLPRNMIDRLADATEGKLAELAFSGMMRGRFGADIELDFNIYPDKITTDYGQDISLINGNPCRSRVDVKATRGSSKWLLVERHKFLADAFVLARVNLPRDFESNFEGLKKLADSSVDCEICGFAYYLDFIDQKTNKPFHRFSSGDRLFDPMNKEKPIGPPLKASENLGLPIMNLRNSDSDWKSFADWIADSALRR